MNKLYLIAIAAALFLASCGPKKSQPESKNAPAGETMKNPVLPKDQHTRIEAYVKEKGLKGEFSPSGLFVAIENPGTGNFPEPLSIVKVEYSGYTLDGKVFDATPEGKTIEFGLNEVIPGWTEGLQKLKKGGSAKLIIPSELAYGANGMGPIPPNTILAFDVKLVDFQKN